jgi:hypothetical protein
MANGGLLVQVGMNINTFESPAEGAQGKTDFKHAKATKATIVRNGGEIHESEDSGFKDPGYTLTEILKFAHEEGVKASYLTWKGLHGLPGNTTEGNELLEKGNEQPTSLAAQIEAAITALGKAVVEETLALMELGNEVWPASGSGHQAGISPTGKAYIETYVAQAKLLKEAGLGWVPYGMEVNTSKEAGAETWMKEIVEYCEAHTAAVKEAFIGGGTEAQPGNRLVSHCYGGKMTAKLESLTSPYGFKDAEGDEYAAQRWMNQQALIFGATGLTVPMCISEIGYNLVSKTATEKAEHTTALWKAVGEFQRGENSADWPTFAAGYKPVLAMVMWFALYEKLTGTEAEKKASGKKEETYGLVAFDSETPNEEAEVFKKFKEGVEALAAVPAVTFAPIARVVSRAATFRSAYR